MGAFGGKSQIMDCLAPEGPVYQAGTLSGNPIAMAIGLETVSILKRGDVYSSLEQKAERLEQGIKDNARRLNRKLALNRVGSMFCLFFTDQVVDSYRRAFASDAQAFPTYFAAMLKNGIYIAPSPFEVSFLSTAHSDADIEQTIQANYASLKQLG